MVKGKKPGKMTRKNIGNPFLIGRMIRKFKPNPVSAIDRGFGDSRIDEINDDRVMDKLQDWFNNCRIGLIIEEKECWKEYNLLILNKHNSPIRIFTPTVSYI